ncbi:hypothetical protein ACUNE3_15205 [Serratia sp. IR-2025]
MNRGGWTVALLLGAMALWTLLAWGVSGLLTWLPTLAEAAGNATLPVNGALSLVPQTVLDTWLLWGIGMLALMLLAALARRYLSAAQR